MKFEDILYKKESQIAWITINRPQKRNAFRPLTVKEMIFALEDAIEDLDIGVIVLSGQGKEAFCSGGDQSLRGDEGYKDLDGKESLNVLKFQKILRSSPKPTIAMVSGYAIGGGHVLHVLCDLTIAAHNAIFGQVGPKVGSFDGGFGASYLAHIVGQKKAREIWYMCRQYNAREALMMGLVNVVVPYEELLATTKEWCATLLSRSPTALSCLKAAFNADIDGQSGIQELAGLATMLYYKTDEAKEGKQAFIEKREPNFQPFRGKYASVD